MISLNIILLVGLPYWALCEDKTFDNVYTKVKMTYLVHKHQPTFAPCKYGVAMSFDQPHFVADPTDDFPEERVCCTGCQTLHIKLPGTDTNATLCCNPQTPYRHSLGRIVSGSDKNSPGHVSGNFGYVHPLHLAFDKIAPKELLVKDEKPRETRIGQGMWPFMFIGAAAAQSVILILALLVCKFTDKKIILETVPDCDYEVIKEAPVISHQSKSQMQSDNINSD